MFNLLKQYNQLLELDSLSVQERQKSLERIFKRDFIDGRLKFKNKIVVPTPEMGKDTMEVLFNHLTRKTENHDNKHREYDRDRSMRIHWIKFHVYENAPEKLTIFSVNDSKAVRTYLYDKDEHYVIILEPRKNKNEYYLITAYYLTGGNKNKIEGKLRRKLDRIY